MPWLGYPPPKVLRRNVNQICRKLTTYRACGLGKDVVRLCTDQPDGAYHDYQDDGQHDRVFRDILALIIHPNVLQKLFHGLSFLKVAPGDGDLR